MPLAECASSHSHRAVSQSGRVAHSCDFLLPAFADMSPIPQPQSMPGPGPQPTATSPLQPAGGSMGSAGFGALASSRGICPGSVGASPIRPTPSYPIGSFDALSRIDVFSSRPPSATSTPMRSSSAAAAAGPSTPHAQSSHGMPSPLQASLTTDRGANNAQTARGASAPLQASATAPLGTPRGQSSLEASNQAQASADASLALQASGSSTSGGSPPARMSSELSRPAQAAPEAGTLPVGSASQAGRARSTPAESVPDAMRSALSNGLNLSGTTDAELRALAALSHGGRIASGAGVPVAATAGASLSNPQWAGLVTSPPTSPDPASSSQPPLVSLSPSPPPPPSFPMKHKSPWAILCAPPSCGIQLTFNAHVHVTSSFSYHRLGLCKDSGIPWQHVSDMLKSLPSFQQLQPSFGGMHRHQPSWTTTGEAAVL